MVKTLEMTKANLLRVFLCGEFKDFFLSLTVIDFTLIYSLKLDCIDCWPEVVKEKEPQKPVQAVAVGCFCLRERLDLIKRWFHDNG